MSDASPSRIAFVITDLDPGGAERALVQLVTRLDRREWEPSVYCLSGPGSLVDPLVKAGIPVLCFGAKGAVHFPSAVLRLRREFKVIRPEIVQSFLFHANITARIAARLARVPIICSGIRVAERRTRTHLWLDRITKGLVDVNVCVSRAVAEFSTARAGLNRDKVVVIPNGVDVESFVHATPANLSEFGIPAGSRVLIGVGRLDPQKGFHNLIPAAAGVICAHDDVHFLIVGEGSEWRDLERSILQSNVQSRFHLAGWRADVARLLRASTALVLPSLWEGMPNVVLEAMASGLPVVATRVEGVEELVIDGQTGFLVPPNHPERLAEAVNRLLADPKLSLELGQQGQARVSAEFSWEKMSQAYVDLYRGQLAKRRT